MALIKCVECGKEFSDKASACPNCACPRMESLIPSPELQKKVLDIVDRSEQKNMLASLVKPRKTELLGSGIKFSSNYFAESYIKELFRKQMRQLKEDTLKNCKKLNINDPSISTGLVKCVMLQGVMTVRNNLCDFRDQAKLDDATIESISDHLSDTFSAFESDLNDIGDMFEEIDSGIENTKLETQLQKAARGQWMVGGKGLTGMMAGAVTGAVLNAGSGFAYDAVGGILLANKRRDAKKAKALLLEQAMSVIGEFYDYMQEYAPAVVLAGIYQAYPFSIWEKDKAQEKKLRKQYKEETDDKKKDELAKLLLKADPYDGNHYHLVFDRILRENADVQQKDTDNLLLIYSWFKGKGEGLKVGILNDMEKHYDIYDAKDFVTAEKLFNISNEIRSQRRIKSKIGECIKNVSEYTPAEVNAALEALTEYAAEYPSNVEAVKDELIKGVLDKCAIKICANSKREIQDSILQLENLPSKGYHLDVSNLIARQQKELAAIIEKEEQREREKAILERTANVISDYNAAARTYSYQKKIFETLEDKEESKLQMNQLMKLCKEISLDSDEDEWNTSIQRIRSFCAEHHYCENLPESLDRQRADAEKRSRTYNGVVYGTKAEAEAAKKELLFIEDVYKKQKDSKKAFCDILHYRFQNKQAKEIILEKEKSLLSDFAFLQKRCSASDTMANTAKAGSALVKAIVVTVIAAVIGLFVIPVPFGPIIAIIVIFGVWGSFKEKVSAIAAAKSDLSHAKEKLAEFESLFRIIDGHIALKQEVIPVPVVKETEHKQCQSSHYAEVKDVDIETEKKPKEDAKQRKNLKYCAFCGKQIERTAKFCNYCGKVTEEADGSADEPKLAEYEFVLSSKEIFSVTGRGVVVKGCISAGTVCVHDNVEVLHADGSSAFAVVDSIEKEGVRKLCDSATVGDNVCLLLSGVIRSQVECGDTIVKR